ncbi:hypothetical protein F4780DRAFT_748484 [Xylariomycetidae sp. FL0641]|nr:hypothetical protein F4780DRAFT_748484 [Xylariomycetidae sp. FL0641]
MADHRTHTRSGIERVKPPTPPPAPRPTPRPRTVDRETDIDIYTSRGETDIDIRERTRSRSRARSRSRPRSERPTPRTRPSYYDEDDLVVEKGRSSLRISDTHRRAQSAAPSPKPDPEWEEEAEYITGKIDSRGKMGEAWHGATKDWTIVDVPPGTERVKMDGVGGGGAEVTWQRYNGVRRAKFLPERDVPASASSTSVVSEPTRERDADGERERLSVQIYDGRDRGREREVEVDEVRDRRISIRESSRPAAKKRNDMWTEITKDLVVREAIERLGYDYEETEYFFYVMQYLAYEDVLELVKESDEIRRARRRRARELEWERDYRDMWERRRERKPLNWDRFEDERVVEREVLYDRSSPRYR